MKLKTIITTRDALKRLSESRLVDYKKMRNLVRLRKAVEEEFACYAEQEKKCVYTYARMRDTGTPAFLSDGRLELKDEASKIAFDKEINALLESDVEDIEPLHLKESDFKSPDDFPTAEDVFALEGLIIFDD